MNPLIVWLLSIAISTVLFFIEPMLIIGLTFVLVMLYVARKDAKFYIEQTVRYESKADKPGIFDFILEE